MKILDIVVLADRRSPVCRAYLSYLHATGYRPAQILLIDFIGVSKKITWIKSLIGKKLTSLLLRLYRHLTTTNIGPHYARLVTMMNADFEVPVPFLEKFNYATHSQVISSVVASNFDDPRIISAIQQTGIKTLLFTGGGRVTNEILDLKDTRVIHIHPGIVPEIKGSDGILWSTLIRKKLGYSIFYMKQGLDTGDVLLQQEYKTPNFTHNKFLQDYTYDEVYNALLQVYDPHMRAKTLIELLILSENLVCPLDDMPVKSQHSDQGRVYFFMHNILRNALLESICE